jgi:hypothetical protein
MEGDGYRFDDVNRLMGDIGADSNRPLPPFGRIVAQRSGGAARRAPRHRQPDSPLRGGDPRDDNGDVAVGDIVSAVGASLEPASVSLEEDMIARRNQLRALVPSLAAAGQSSRCVLCNIGFETFDAGEHGTMLIARMLKKMRNKLSGNRMVVAEMATDYFNTLVRRAAKSAEPPIRLRKMSLEDTYEHLSTMLHTLNPELFLINKLHTTGKIDIVLTQSLCNSDKKRDQQVLKDWMQLTQLQLTLFRMIPSKMLFGGSSMTDPIQPDMVALISELERKYMPNSLHEAAEAPVTDSEGGSDSEDSSNDDRGRGRQRRSASSRSRSRPSRALAADLELGAQSVLASSPQHSDMDFSFL